MRTMVPSRLLACFVLLVAGGRRLAATSMVDLGTWLRTQWLMAVRDARLRGEGGVSFSQPIRGLVKKQLLYSPVGIGYHLQVLSNGSVGGVHEHTEHSWMKVFALQPGLVGIQALRSGLYLCMSSDGSAHGSGRFTADCLFKETLEESHHTSYASVSHPGLYLALSKQGEVKRVTGRTKKHPGILFLPRLRE
ncbi:fibroblast growth factor 4A-like [Scleropages formosus]|nr:fibroblast growth factor 4A-like [Scleropages formosus]